MLNTRYEMTLEVVNTFLKEKGLNETIQKFFESQKVNEVIIKVFDEFENALNEIIESAPEELQQVATDIANIHCSEKAKSAFKSSTERDFKISLGMPLMQLDQHITLDSTIEEVKEDLNSKNSRNLQVVEKIAKEFIPDMLMNYHMYVVNCSIIKSEEMNEEELCGMINGILEDAVQIIPIDVIVSGFPTEDEKKTEAHQCSGNCESNCNCQHSGNDDHHCKCGNGDCNSSC